MKTNMRTLFFSILMMCSVFTLYAQTYNTQQEKLRTNISRYLQGQGYTPEKQEDGLKFKHDGTNYYIEIDPTEKQPMFLRLCRYVKFDDKLTREYIMERLNDCNVKYAIKVTCQDKAIVVAAELFVEQSSEFTDILDKLLELIDSAYDNLKEI